VFDIALCLVRAKIKGSNRNFLICASESSLTQSVTVSGAPTTSYTVTGLITGSWYFAVAADAADGTDSAKSNIGSKTF
jgi:hypothetical protein